VEVYGLNHQLDSHLTVMNTLGSVGKGGTALIGDFTLEGSTKGKMLLRALGNGLKDPTLELVDANGSIITAHDNGEHAECRDRGDGIGPNKRTDSAISTDLDPGSYRAIVGGKKNKGGRATLGVYRLP
jgi:hypothetical protein